MIGREADADAAEPTESESDAGADDAYGGLFSAFPYAYRASDSRLFRSFVVGGGLLSLVIALLFVLSLVVLISNTGSGTGGTFTFSRAFLLVLMLLVIGPLLAPVLFVARRHRRTGSTVDYDRALAAGGYLFVVGLYLGLVISTPAEQERAATGALGPVLATLYALPRAAGVVPPLLAAAAIAVLHRRYGE